MTYEEIKELIKSKKPDIEEETLKYFTNYFFVLMKKDILNGYITIDELITNALIFADKVVFYDNNHPVAQRLGLDVKGYRDPDSKTIFIRDSLEEPLKEMVVYHELHHAIQTNPSNFEVGLNQESNFLRLIMEGQTQFFAEEVYKEIHNVSYEEQDIKSENLRMAKGGTVKSSLHNYEMYDNLITKLAILLDVSKEFLVMINYLTKDNMGINLLQEKYEIAKEKYHLNYSFHDFMLFFDYPYVVDYMGYINNPNKDLILNGGETSETYEIYTDFGATLSLAKQQWFLQTLDKTCFLALVDYGGNYEEFAKYIIDDEVRALAYRYVTMLQMEKNSK